MGTTPRSSALVATENKKYETHLPTAKRTSQPPNASPNCETHLSTAKRTSRIALQQLQRNTLFVQIQISPDTAELKI